MHFITGPARFVGHRLVLVSMVVCAALVASLVTPQARSIWFQVLQADAGVTTAPQPTTTSTVTFTATATETLTSTPTPTETPDTLAVVPDQSGAQPCDGGVALVTITNPIVGRHGEVGANGYVRK